MRNAKRITRLAASLTLAGLAFSASAADSPAPPAPPAIESWDEFTDAVHALGPQMLAKLPTSMQDDPQIRQEVARLTLEALATMELRAVSSQDGDHPNFLPWGNVTQNIGQPNADTTYKHTVITPGGTYRLRGEKGSDRIAKIAQFGSQKPENGRSWVYTITYNDLNALHADADGHYDVILSPSRPKDWTGDWWQLDPATTTLMLRMVSADWTKERDPTVSIERVDTPPERPRPTAAELRERMKAIAQETARMAMLLVGHVAKLQSEGIINKFKAFDVSQIGGQLTGQFYYEGAYDLKDDEALIIEAKVPDHCLYSSLLLTNAVYETTDWYNNHSSLNDTQMKIGKDNMMRVVVSAKDPGVANWLDTAGYPVGAIQGRWTECSAQPIPMIKKVALKDVRKHLPKDTAMVTPAERATIIRDRRAHLQQRILW
jgi:hypothetical protein